MMVTEPGRTGITSSRQFSKLDCRLHRLDATASRHLYLAKLPGMPVKGKASTIFFCGTVDSQSTYLASKLSHLTGQLPLRWQPSPSQHQLEAKWATGIRTSHFALLFHQNCPDPGCFSF